MCKFDAGPGHGKTRINVIDTDKNRCESSCARCDPSFRSVFRVLLCFSVVAGVYGLPQQNFTARTPFVHDPSGGMRDTKFITSERWMMTSVPARFVFWAPRLGGLAMAAFLALFALDAANGQSGTHTMTNMAIHLLPSLLVLALVALGWNFDWIGAIGFSALAFLYAAMAWGRLDWISVISTPLLLVGLLFYASWRSRVVAHRA
jgi:hypothetical protein